MAAFICQIGPLGTKNWRFVRNTIVAGFPPTSSVGPLNSDLLPGKSCDPLGASAGLDTSPEKLKELRIAWNLHTSPKPSVYSLFKRQLPKNYLEFSETLCVDQTRGVASHYFPCLGPLGSNFHAGSLYPLP